MRQFTLKPVEHIVFTRDEGCCGSCGGAITGTRGVDWSIHHRAPRGSGGTKRAWVNQPANLILLCGSGTTGCHGNTESHRDRSIAEGFLLRANGRAIATDIPIRHEIHGLVLLNDSGFVEPVIEAVARELWIEFGHTKGGFE